MREPGWWRRAGKLLAARRAELRFSVRLSVAGVAALAVADALALPQGYWTILTAIIVMQASVGGSLKAAIERLLGTLSGAVYGAVIALLLPRAGAWPVAALALALAPLAFLAAVDPRFRIGPVTATIVLFGAAGRTDPLLSSLDRVLEIGLGSVIGLAVALIVLPGRAHAMLAEAAERCLSALAGLLAGALAGHDGARQLQPLLERSRAALARIETLTEEAERERASHLTDEADPVPLLRTLRRLRNDIVLLARATSERLPGPVGECLDGPLAEAGGTIGAFLGATGRALAKRAPPPAPDAAAASLDRCAAAVSLVRERQLTRGLPHQTAGRIFAIAFVLEQTRTHLAELHDRAAELARPAR